MKFTSLIGLIIVATSSKIHCAPIQQENSDQIEVLKFYDEYFGKPQYSELPKKYAVDFIPEESKKETLESVKLNQLKNFKIKWKKQVSIDGLTMCQKMLKPKRTSTTDAEIS